MSRRQKHGLQTMTDLVELVRATEGWRVQETRSGWAFYPPKGPVVHVHRTPSDWRALRNDVARLRRCGLLI